MTTPPPSSSSPQDATAARAAALGINDVLSPSAIDDLLAEADAKGLSIDGPNGLLGRLTKAVLERALDAEMADHLGYEAGDPAGRDLGNSRNGHGRKTVHTTVGPVELTVPRDGDGSFTPGIVPKRKRRLGNVEDMIISLYTRGMSTRDITAHLHEVYGTTVSAATISRITDVVADEVALWQSRPVDPAYPILYIDALRIKIRDAGVVANKAAHLVVGVDLEGRKQVLGVWIQQTEGAKFWMKPVQCYVSKASLPADEATPVRGSIVLRDEPPIYPSHDRTFTYRGVIRVLPWAWLCARHSGAVDLPINMEWRSAR